MKGRQLDLGRADLRLSFFSEIYSPIPIDFRRMYMHAFPRSYSCCTMVMVMMMVMAMAAVAVTVTVLARFRRAFKHPPKRALELAFKRSLQRALNDSIYSVYSSSELAVKTAIDCQPYVVP